MLKTKDGKTLSLGYSNMFKSDGNPIYLSLAYGGDSDVWLTPDEAQRLAESLLELANKAKNDN